MSQPGSATNGGSSGPFRPDDTMRGVSSRAKPAAASRTASPGVVPPGASASGAVLRGSVPLLAVVLLFIVSGAAGLVYEVIWIRSLTLVFGKTVHAASAVLAAFMAGLAIGSAWGGRVIDRRIAAGAHPLKIYGLLEAGIGLAALLLPLVMSGIGLLYVALSGPFEHLSIWLSGMRFVLATLALLPATCLMGATLP